MNAISVDLEDWFCVYNLREIIPFDKWGSCESRICENTMRLLDLFDRYSVNATFFVLGWIAEQHPALILEIEKHGHEIGIHGFNHRPVHELTPEEFRMDIEKSLTIVRGIVQQPVYGYRAPMFSIVEKSLWALDILSELGLQYDSSVYPVSLHPEYGIKNQRLEMYSHSDTLTEVPLSCATIGGMNIPCGGGGYFRLYPYPLFRKLVQICIGQGRPLIFYFHPWEIDPDQPVMKLPFTRRFRHYNNLEKTYNRLEKLLREFQFTTVGELVKEYGKRENAKLSLYEQN